MHQRSCFNWRSRLALELAFGFKLVTPAIFAFSVFVSHAQENSFDGLLEEIIVTATRRESAIQDTPLAITALNDVQIRESGVSDLRDIDLITPGLWIGGNAGFGQQGVQIRGVGSVLTGIGGDEGVGTYVDGLYQGRASGLVFRFADIERVEVLRGPQGALYGRNATGGAINIITKTPKEDLEGALEFTATEFDGLGLDGYALVPLVDDTLSAKFAFGSFQRDGYAYSPTLNSDINAEDLEYFSTALRWTPNYDTELILRAYTGQSATPAVYKAILDGLPLDTIPIEYESFDERGFDSTSLTFQREFSSITATAIVGYLETNVSTQSDSDGGPIDNVRFLENQSSEQLSVELRLTSNSSGRINWMLGASFIDEEASVRTPFNILRSFSPTGFYFAGDVETEAKAIYGNINYEISEKTNLTVGARYNDEDKDWLGCIAFFTRLETDFANSLCDGSFSPDSRNDVSTNPYAILDYALSDQAMLYFSATNGFRSGGWNWVEPTIPGLTGFGPEEVWSYESGVKISLWSGLASLNVAGFIAKYNDMQVRVNDPSSSLVRVQNASNATINGLEAEFAAQLSPEFDVSATIAWLDATYDEFAYIDTNGVAQDHGGNFLNRAPEFQSSFMARYEFDLGNLGSLIPRFEWQYSSEIYHDPFNVLPKGSDQFSLVNIRAQFTPNDANWGMTAFIENLTDERYFEHTFEPVLPQDAPALISRPRIYGIKAFYEF